MSKSGQPFKYLALFSDSARGGMSESESSDYLYNKLTDPNAQEFKAGKKTW